LEPAKPSDARPKLDVSDMSTPPEGDKRSHALEVIVIGTSLPLQSKRKILHPFLSPWSKAASFTGSARTF
jgi:hypothetical protein